MLAVIGKGWLRAQDSQGRRRLDNSEDFVRIEIESAMRLGKLVIPVLVNNTEMPRAAELPDSMKAFARRQAVWITNTRLRADAESLAAKINRELSDVAARQKADEEGRARQEKRQREEAEQLLRQAQEREREAEEERKRATAVPMQRSEPAAAAGADASAGERATAEVQGETIATFPSAAWPPMAAQPRQKEGQRRERGQAGAPDAERPSGGNRVSSLKLGISILTVTVVSAIVTAVLALAPATVAALLGEWLTDTATGDRWFVQVWEIAAGLFFIAFCSLLIFFAIRKRLRNSAEHNRAR
jgi:hypothetical protein